MADDMDDEPLNAPFSAHARGVPLSAAENLDFGSNFESFLLQLLDITGAGVHLLLANGWLTIIQLVITIACTSFYTFLGVFSVQADLDFSILSFVVLLPLVLSVFRSIQRRDCALKSLATGVSLWGLKPGFDICGTISQNGCRILLSAVQQLQSWHDIVAVLSRLL